MKVEHIAEILFEPPIWFNTPNNYEKLESKLIIKTKIHHIIEEQNMSRIQAIHQKDSNST